MPSGYTPTVLLGTLTPPLQASVPEALQREGWDVRLITDLVSNGEGEELLEPVALINASRSIQPDLIVMAGTEDDPWAFRTICELRVDPATHDLGMIVLPIVSLPPDMDVTPMSGPDAWVYPDTGPDRALEIIHQTAKAAAEGRLEWAHREWSAIDRDRHGIKSLKVRIELGRPIEPSVMAEWLYGRRNMVDIQIWDDAAAASNHAPGWRFGRAKRYRRALLVHQQEESVEDNLVGDQVFTLYARSGRLLLAGSHAIAELAGGWASID